MQKSPVLKEKVQSEAGQMLRNCLFFGQNLRLKAKQPNCLLKKCVLSGRPTAHTQTQFPGEMKVKEWVVGRWNIYTNGTQRQNVKTKGEEQTTSLLLSYRHGNFKLPTLFIREALTVGDTLKYQTPTQHDTTRFTCVWRKVSGKQSKY